VHQPADGKERSRTFDRKVEAQRWLTTETADLARGNWTDPGLGRMTFAQYVQIWEQSLDVRESTRELNLGVVRNYLLPRFGATPLARISTSDVKMMVASEVGEARLSKSAIRRHGIVLSSILKAAVADGRIGKNPCTGVRLPAEDRRDMRFLTAEQVAHLADAVSPAFYRPLSHAGSIPVTRSIGYLPLRRSIGKTLLSVRRFDFASSSVSQNFRVRDHCATPVHA
jgi:Phage integrase, N-terminal SAM-like domain